MIINYAIVYQYSFNNHSNVMFTTLKGLVLYYNAKKMTIDCLDLHIHFYSVQYTLINS